MLSLTQGVLKDWNNFDTIPICEGFRQLHRKIIDKNISCDRPFILTGFFGIGKTTLAIEWARNNRSKYTYIRFVNMRFTEEEKDGLKTFARDLNIIDYQYKSSCQLLKEVAKKIQKIDSSFLIIYDDLEYSEEIKLGVEFYNKLKFNQHILITSRSTQWVSGSSRRIPGFDLNESCAYLKERYKNIKKLHNPMINETVLNMIVEQFAYHPFSLNLVIKEMQSGGSLLGSYYNQWNNNRSNFRKLTTLGDRILSGYDLCLMSEISANELKINKVYLAIESDQIKYRTNLTPGSDSIALGGDISQQNGELYRAIQAKNLAELSELCKKGLLDITSKRGHTLLSNDTNVNNYRTIKQLWERCLDSESSADQENILNFLRFLSFTHGKGCTEEMLISFLGFSKAKHLIKMFEDKSIIMRNEEGVLETFYSLNRILRKIVREVMNDNFRTVCDRVLMLSDVDQTPSTINFRLLILQKAIFSSSSSISGEEILSENITGYMAYRNKGGQIMQQFFAASEFSDLVGELPQPGSSSINEQLIVRITSIFDQALRVSWENWHAFLNDTRQVIMDNFPKRPKLFIPTISNHVCHGISWCKNTYKNTQGLLKNLENIDSNTLLTLQSDFLFDIRICAIFLINERYNNNYYNIENEDFWGKLSDYKEEVQGIQESIWREKTITMFKNSLQNCSDEKYPNHINLILILNMLGVIYIEKNEAKDAKVCLKFSLELLQLISVNISGFSDIEKEIKENLRRARKISHNSCFDVDDCYDTCCNCYDKYCSCLSCIRSVEEHANSESQNTGNTTSIQSVQSVKAEISKILQTKRNGTNFCSPSPGSTAERHLLNHQHSNVRVIPSDRGNDNLQIESVLTIRSNYNTEYDEKEMSSTDIVIAAYDQRRSRSSLSSLLPTRGVSSMWSQSSRSNNQNDLSMDVYNDQQIRQDLMRQASGNFIEKIEELYDAQDVQNYINNINDEEDFQNLLLYFAASNKDNRLIIINEALNNEENKRHYKVFAGNNQKYTIAHIAAALGDVELLRICYRQGIILKQKAKNGLGPNALDYAIAFGRLNAVEFLINDAAIRPTEVDTPLLDGSRALLAPLPLSIAKGRLDLVALFLKDSRFNDSLSFSNGNVLHLAVLSFSLGGLKLLLDCDALKNDSSRLNEENKEGMTPLALAAAYGNIAAMELLVKNKHVKKDKSSQKFNRYTPLHFAIQAAQIESVSFLIRENCDLTKMMCSFIILENKTKNLNAYNLAEELMTQAENKLSTVESEEDKSFYTQYINKYQKIFQTISTIVDRGVDTQFAELSVRAHRIKNLVFAGGGIKGLVYPGVIEILASFKQKDTNVTATFLQEIERFAGTSAGAITAALLALGYSPEDLRKEINGLMPFTRFLEGGSLRILEQSHLRRLCTVLISALKLVNPIEFYHFVKALYQADGVSSGTVFRNWIEEKIRNKIKIETGKEVQYCTFGELKTLIEKPGSKFKHLHVVVTRLSPEPEIITLSTEDAKYSDYIISDAIRASMSVPIVFSPHKLYQKNVSANGKISRNPEEGTAKYVDGGLLANYPITTFDRAKYKYTGLVNFFAAGNQPDFPIINDESLGFNLVEQEQEQETESNRNNHPREATRIDLVNLIGELYYYAEKMNQQHQGNASYRTVDIKLKKMSFLKFDLSVLEMEELMQAGREAVESSKCFDQYKSTNSASTSSLTNTGIVKLNIHSEQHSSSSSSSSASSNTVTQKKSFMSKNCCIQ